MSRKKYKIAVLASGSGSTVEAFINASHENNLIDSEVCLVICNNPPSRAGVYKRIDDLNKIYSSNIDMVHISGITHPKGQAKRGQTDEESRAILSAVKERRCDLVVLMGYMKIVRGELLSELGWKQTYDSIYSAKMLNTHPGPIPETIDTYGAGASEKVLKMKLNQSKHTVHVVAEGVDMGPIIAEHPVPIFKDDTKESLFARVQAIEKAALPYAIDSFLKKQQNYLNSN